MRIGWSISFLGLCSIPLEYMISERLKVSQSQISLRNARSIFATEFAMRIGWSISFLPFIVGQFYERGPHRTWWMKSSDQVERNEMRIFLIDLPVIEDPKRTARWILSLRNSGRRWIGKGHLRTEWIARRFSFVAYFYVKFFCLPSLMNCLEQAWCEAPWRCLHFPFTETDSVTKVADSRSPLINAMAIAAIAR